MTIAEIINSSNGKWSDKVSDIDFLFLNESSKSVGFSKSIENQFEVVLDKTSIPSTENKPKWKWLKTTICEVLHDPETTNTLNQVELEDAKKKLVEIVFEYIIKIIPIAGPLVDVITKIIIYILKKAFNKGISEFCEE
ncbi:hypothetical protein [Lutibacter sp.]|uniref:hypothetical protein n=1 Tax=Lutibacter sp. TaxID=1925666 RepID=UPI002732E36B|nr:hypothetical protein [Lutibacter sp.]MDP3311876.1 hypothetical protein [Lutibacter sp.]